MNKTPVNHSAYDPLEDGQIDFWDLWGILWSEKWWIICASFVCGAGGMTYSMLAAPVYEAKAVLSPVQQTPASSASSLLAQFAPIAGIVGVSASPQVGLATLQSSQFAEDFIIRNDLLTVLAGGDNESPDVRDALRVFQKDVAKIASDPQTGLVTITVRWKDPVVAASWANELARSANETLRHRALETAERNLSYLKTELPVTTSVTIQQSIGRLLDQEMQTVMLARGNPEYAFSVIDPAKAPKTRSSPKRVQMIVVALLAGGFVGVLLVFVRRAIRSRRQSYVVDAASAKTSRA